MDMMDPEIEVFLIAVAMSHSLQEADFTVIDFDFAGADGMVIPIEQEGFPELQLFGGIQQDPNPAGLRLADPAFKFLFSQRSRDRIKKETEPFFHVIGGGQRLVELQSLLQPVPFIFGAIGMGFKVLRRFEQQPAAAFKYRFAHGIGLPVQIPA